MKQCKFMRITALLLSTLLIFSACSSKKSNSLQTTNADSQALQQTTMTDVSQNISKQTISENKNNINLQVSYPETKAININVMIITEIRKYIDNFKNNAKDKGGSLTIDYTLSPGENEDFGVCYTVNSVINGSTLQSAFAHVYNLKEDSAYSIIDFFPTDCQTSIQKLSDEIRTVASSNGIDVNSDLFKNGTQPNPNLFNNFILGTDKFTFIFPHGQIADQSVKIDIPFSKFEGTLKKGKPSIKNSNQFTDIQTNPIESNTTSNSTTIDSNTSNTSTSNSTTTNSNTSDTTVSISSQNKKIALTFDDGPGPYTDEILEALKKHNAKATFFMVGTSIQSYPEQVKHVHEAGCEIGNHTYSHKTLTKISESEIRSQIDRVSTTIESLTGEKPKFVRPPGGSVNKTVRQIVNQPFILWNVDTRDWKYRDTDKVYNYVMDVVSNGDIILMHDIHKTSAKAAIRLIDSLTKEGYELVTVSELFDTYGPKLENGKSYSFVTGNTWKEDNKDEDNKG